MIPTPCELLAVKLKTSNTPLIVIGIDRPTDNKTYYSTSTCDAISSIARKFPNSPLWITGDINLPDVQWKTNTVTKHQYTKQINEHFLDTFSMLGLSQMVTFPTRLDNTLDVFSRIGHTSLTLANQYQGSVTTMQPSMYTQTSCQKDKDLSR